MWWRHPINVKGCAHYQTTGNESFISIAWELQILGPKNLSGVHLTPPPFVCSRVKTPSTRSRVLIFENGDFFSPNTTTVLT